MGRTVTHKGIICHKAYLEGKVTPQIAQETCHSPEAVDNYILDFARVFFAVVQRGMSAQETAFAIQRPPFLVEEYLKLIREFGLDEDRAYQRASVQMELSNDQVEVAPGAAPPHIERREQDPIAG
jgi:hypothetical protein